MMNILVATNDAYYPRLKIFTKSLHAHNRDFTISVLFSNLSAKNRDDFLWFTKKRNIPVRFVAVNEQRSAEYKLIHQITVETYYRFQILDVYPTQERAVWMDIDTVVLDDLSAFYYDDFDDNYVIACPGNNEKNHLERLGLAPSGCYFNAGIILFNLKKIREDFLRDFLYEAYEKHEDRIRFADQDVLNIVFADKIKRENSRRYNYIITSGQKTTRRQYQQIKDSVAVVHYIRHIKPWQYYYQGRIRFLYLKAMFPVYPIKTLWLLLAGEVYKLKRNKKTLENSIR